MTNNPYRKSAHSNVAVIEAPTSRRAALKALGLLAGARIVAPSIAFSQTPVRTGPVISGKGDFYVSVDGDDRWSGKLPVGNGGASDGPFATLARARDAVRKLKRKTPNKDVIVLIREGVYRLDETVDFGLDDSGAGSLTNTYAGYPGEKPVFSSGRDISGWKMASADLPGLPTEARGKVRVADVPGQFRALYDADGMLPRARSAGFIPLSGSTKDTLHFPADRLKNWSNVEDIEIVVRPHHDWDMHDKGNALVRLRGAERCVIEGCRFAHSGSGAIPVDLHGQENQISGNLIHHTPYTGMIISGCMTHFFQQPDNRELVRTKDADTDYNFYYCAGDRSQGEKMLAKQHGDGLDKHSLAADPLFMDPGKADFGLKPGSPALRLGIKPIDVSKIGLRATDSIDHSIIDHSMLKQRY